VKTLEKTALRQVFVAEARAMMPLAHDNVLRLLGITVADTEPWRAVLEFCEHDSLHTVVCHWCGGAGVGVVAGVWLCAAGVVVIVGFFVVVGVVLCGFYSKLPTCWCRWKIFL
jgi:hypothetical protein